MLVEPYLKNIFQEFPEDSYVAKINNRILYGPRGPTWSSPGHANPANAMIRNIHVSLDRKVGYYLDLRWDGELGFVYNVANGIVFKVDKEAYETILSSLGMTLREFQTKYPEIYNRLFVNALVR